MGLQSVRDDLVAGNIGEDVCDEPDTRHEVARFGVGVVLSGGLPLMLGLVDVDPADSADPDGIAGVTGE
ncbi:MAG: hypothetical protein R3B46_03340 [Phycisphaerales bacterium]